MYINQYKILLGFRGGVLRKNEIKDNLKAFSSNKYFREEKKVDNMSTNILCYNFEKISQELMAYGHRKFSGLITNKLYKKC